MGRLGLGGIFSLSTIFLIGFVVWFATKDLPIVGHSSWSYKLLPPLMACSGDILVKRDAIYSLFILYIASYSESRPGYSITNDVWDLQDEYFGPI